MKPYNDPFDDAEQPPLTTPSWPLTIAIAFSAAMIFFILYALYQVSL